MKLSPQSLTFCLLSFEGPDRYALAGGLGVRVTHLAETLAERGFETHLIFVGDPGKPGREMRNDGDLTLHRWGQWIRPRPRTGTYHDPYKRAAGIMGGTSGPAANRGNGRYS